MKQYDNIYSGLYISSISLDPIKNQVYEVIFRQIHLSFL